MKLLKVETGSFGNVNMEQSKKDIPASSSLDITAAQLVLGYLSHHCYAETARAFQTHWIDQDGERDGTAASNLHSFSLQSLDFRHYIINLIMDGKIGEAIDYLNEYFPQVLGDGMSDDPANEGQTKLKFLLLRQQFIEMVRKGDAKLALEYTESTLAPLAHTHPSMLSHLQDVIVLLAYSDPADSPVKHLLSLEHRRQLSDQVNSAILNCNESSLESCLRHLIVVKQESSSSSSETAKLTLADLLQSDLTPTVQ